MKKLSKELIGASSVPILLSVLSEEESYGYEIIQKVKKISGGKIEWGEGTLYPILHKMEKKDLISSSWKVTENGRKRKYYKINETGKEKLEEEKENWEILNTIIANLWNRETNLI